MSTTIGVCPQKRVDGRWQDLNIRVFEGRSNDFELFRFLGHTAGRAVIPPIAAPRGLPDDYEDVEIFGEGFDDCSVFTLIELTSYDYDQTVEETSAIDHGGQTSIRDLLGPSYFEDLGRLQREGVERIIVGFC